MSSATEKGQGKDREWLEEFQEMLLELIQKLRDYMLYEKGYDLYTEPCIAAVLKPFAEKLLARQNAADLSHYNDKFSSFTQLSNLLASIDGRGTDKVIEAKVDDMASKLHFGRDKVVPKPTVIPDKYKDLLNPHLPDHFGGNP